MKIAFASADGKTINQRFGQADTFQIWEIGHDCAKQCGDISAITSNIIRGERNTARADAIAGCSIVCTVDVSVRALAKIVARNIFHLRTATETPIAEIIGKLQNVMRDNPPPWMKKVMGMQPVYQKAE
jgi:nitrogen fixation protein NifX